jgi:hypothetical protein
MASIGIGVSEIRVREDSGAFRVIYVAKFEEAIRAACLSEEGIQNAKGRDRSGAQAVQDDA